MSDVANSVLLICSAFYGIGIFVLTIALLKYFPAKSEKKPLVSVIVAARNESANIRGCLEYLLAQSYDIGKTEIIVVDDRSTDSTAAIVESFSQKNPSVRLIRVEKIIEGFAPKKYALKQGIEGSKGEIILCTDADCHPESNWISSMVAAFADDVALVLGYSPIEPNNPWSFVQNFQAIDSLALATVNAASTSLQKPVTATGRSIAYRKSVFFEVGGFGAIKEYLSGDDDLFLGLVKKTRWKFAYVIFPESNVPTLPVTSPKKYFHQKIRQTSKTGLYSGKLRASLMTFAVYNSCLIVYVPSLAADLSAFFPWIIKIAADLILLTAGAIRFQRIGYLKYYPLAALVYPMYVVFFGILGQVANYTWKDSTSN